jgi:hypothetical protein
MSTRRWSNVSYLDAIRPDLGWRTEYAFLASYSADLVALVAGNSTFVATNFSSEATSSG